LVPSGSAIVSNASCPTIESKARSDFSDCIRTWKLKRPEMSSSPSICCTSSESSPSDEISNRTG
jgi:hypothetical protein